MKGLGESGALSMESYDGVKRWDDVIAEVRRMPTEQQSQLDEKKERARRLMMEGMLDQAMCTRKLFQAIQENPALTPDELREQLQQVNFIMRPEVLEELISEIIATRQRIENFLDSYAITPDVSDEGTFWLRRLSNNDAPNRDSLVPNGTITVDRSYPLALVIYVENERDFDLIDPRQNYGAFYTNYDYTIIVNEEGMTESKELPIVCIHGARPDANTAGSSYNDRITRIIAHETDGHAQNNSMMKPYLEKRNKKFVWGRFADLKYDKSTRDLHVTALNTVADEHSEEKIKDLAEWRKIMNYALNFAKDELLADLSALRHSLEYKDEIKIRGNIYDYFKKIGINENSVAYKLLRDEYEHTIETQCATAQAIIDAYHDFDLTERLEIFRWVLAGIPLDQWQKVLCGTPFFDEAEQLNTIKVEYAIAQSPQQQLMETAYNDLKERCQRDQGRPLFQYIEQYEAEVATILNMQK